MENGLSKKERLEAICDKFFGGNKSAMGRELGQTPQTIASWFDRETWKACEIYEKLPQLNAEWVLTGEGEMMKEMNANA